MAQMKVIRVQLEVTVWVMYLWCGEGDYDIINDVYGVIHSIFGVGDSMTVRLPKKCLQMDVMI